MSKKSHGEGSRPFTGPSRRDPDPAVPPISIEVLPESNYELYGSIIKHAVSVIREHCPPAYEAHREALHRSLLGNDYRHIKIKTAPAHLEPELRTLVSAAHADGNESIKNTFECLKQAVEASQDAARDREMSSAAAAANWKPSQLRKLPEQRRKARERLERGGDPRDEQRVTGDFDLGDGRHVPGTVSDGYLARTPRHRQGPRVLDEEARQILFELTEGSLQMRPTEAAAAIEYLLLYYLGTRSDSESLRWWWNQYRIPRHR